MPKLTTLCAECGTPFEHFPSQARECCSRRCARILHARRMREEGRPGSPRPKARTGAVVACQVCGKEFYAQAWMLNKGRKYCSQACKGLTDRKPKITKTCRWCGATFRVQPSHAHRVHCSPECTKFGRTRTGTFLDRTFNGMPVKQDDLGYIWIWFPERAGLRYGGWYQEHRYVVEEDLGRRLASEEHVHHISGVKDDNRLENLLVMAHGDHARRSSEERLERIQREREELAEYRQRYGPLVTDA